MKQIHARILYKLDLHLLLVWLLALPAATPLIQPNTITDSADGLLHLYRVVALDHALSQGSFFPRWLPDLAYGYGLPLFVFYAPLSYYVTLGLKLLGLGVVGALNTSFILALLLSGTGVYLFVKDRFGPKAGVLAGVAYVYAPILLLNTLSRGSLPAVWATATFPFVFWIFGRLIRQSVTEPRRVLPLLSLSALIFGAALLMHNISSLLFVPLLGLYLSVELVTQFIHYKNQSTNLRPQAEQNKLWNSWGATFLRQVVLPAGLAGILGPGLAAFFLLPAVVEKEFAQVERVIVSPDFDFHFNFATVKELLSLPKPANTGLLNPHYPFTLGLIQAGLAVAGVLGIHRLRATRQRSLSGSKFWSRVGRLRDAVRLSSRRSPRIGGAASRPVLDTGFVPPRLEASSRGSARGAGTERLTAGWEPLPLANLDILSLITFAVVGLAGTIFMMLPISVEVWERLPLLAFAQHPRRLLSLAALVLAILAGSAVTALPGRLRFGLTLAGVALIFITTIPLLYPRYRDPFPTEPTLLDMMAYEHASGAIGTTSFGEYLPVWVEQVPPKSPLEPMYRAGATIERLDPAYLPAKARLEAASYGFNRVELTIDAPEPYQAIFHTFYFPGWEAWVDGQPGLIAPVSERGLVGVTMPAGRHHLQLYFRETSLRRVANTGSIVSLAVILVMLILGIKRLKVDLTTPSPRPNGFRGRQLTILAGLAIVLIAAKTFYFDRFDNPFKHTFDGTYVAGVDVAKQVNFGGQVNLLGYDLDRQTAAPGQNFNLTVYWQARRPLATDYSALAHLVDPERHLYVAQDNLHPGQLVTSQWQPWGFAQDPHLVPVPPGTPPGDYFLVTGLYDPSTWARLPVIEGGDPGWAGVIAIPVTVAKSPQPPEIDELGIIWPVRTQTSIQTSKVSETFEVFPIRLLGATPEREVILRNDFLRVALFWEAMTEPKVDYQVGLSLMTEDGEVVLEQNTQPSHNRYPTTRWTAGERVRDNHALWIPPHFPAGTYHLQVRLLDETGQPIGDWVELGSLEFAD